MKARSDEEDRPFSLCKLYASGRSHNASCKFSHDLFDTRRAVKLVETVDQRNNRNRVTSVTMEVIHSAPGDHCLQWKVTLSHASGVISATKADLTSAMNMVERRYASLCLQSANNNVCAFIVHLHCEIDIICSLPCGSPRQA